MIWQAVHAGFGYFQREAGYTRTGSHNTRVHGRETGQWHEADLAVAHWLQHTSRDGDMQLHVHSQIAHVAKTGTDGKWRAPDSLGYNEHIGAVAAIVSQHLEEALTGRFGLEWVARDDGHGFEIKGISGRDDARVLLPPRVHHRGPAHARRAVRATVRTQAVPARTRAARAGVELQNARGQEGRRAGFHAAARRLGRQARTHPGVSLASVAPSVWHNGTGRAATQPRNADGPALTELELSRAAQKAVALAQQEKSAWTRADVIKYLGRVLPRSGQTRPRPPRCWRTWPTGRCDRSSSRSSAWRHPSSWTFRAACCARTGAASTSGTAASGTPRARSWSWKSACSRKHSADNAPRLTRAQAAHALGAEQTTSKTR